MKLWLGLFLKNLQIWDSSLSNMQIKTADTYSRLDTVLPGNLNVPSHFSHSPSSREKALGNEPGATCASCESEPLIIKKRFYFIIIIFVLFYTRSRSILYNRMFIWPWPNNQHNIIDWSAWVWCCSDHTPSKSDF